MPPRRRPDISSRKQPQQDRSTQLVEDALQAAVQVLASEGAERFTMARVAEKAGVSVGSIYQYFPNKAALLFRLQSDEWRRTTGLIASILDDQDKPPLERLRRLVHAFVASEREEAEVREALDDAAPRYRDAPEARAVRSAGEATFRRFLKEALPSASEPTLRVAGDLIMTTLSKVGKHLSEAPLGAADVEAITGAMADMFCAYLSELGRR